MALYEKVEQLIDARPTLKRTVVPRIGELHLVIAPLRAVGNSIIVKNFVIDDAWIEVMSIVLQQGKYSSVNTTYKRSLRAHIYS